MNTDAVDPLPGSSATPSTSKLDRGSPNTAEMSSRRALLIETSGKRRHPVCIEPSGVVEMVILQVVSAVARGSVVGADVVVVGAAVAVEGGLSVGAAVVVVGAAVIGCAVVTGALN